MQASIDFINNEDRTAFSKLMQRGYQVKEPLGSIGFLFEFEWNNPPGVIKVAGFDSYAVIVIPTVAFDQQFASITQWPSSSGAIGKRPEQRGSRRLRKQRTQFRFRDRLLFDLKSIDSRSTRI